MSFHTDTVRNIAIAGHGGTGKTTLVDQILFNGSVINKAETVESGRTVSDYTDEEIEKKISVYASLSSITWKNSKINILDTPGSSDFIGEVIASFSSAESAVVLVSARAMVQIETIKLWRRLDNLNMPRVVFINKLEKERSDFEKTYMDIKDKFKTSFVPLTIPIGSGENYKGVIDLIEEKAYLIPATDKKESAADIPQEMKDTVNKYRLSLIESAAEGSDELLEKYFEEGSLTKEEIWQGIKTGIKENKIVPVLCGSAANNSGISSLLDCISTAGISPDGIEKKGKNQKEEDIITKIDSTTPLSCFVFKTCFDQFSGKISFIKIITGILTSDSEIYNSRENKKEKISKLFTCQGKKLVEVEDLYAGDIGILIKLESVKTNESLSSPANIIEYVPLKLPQPAHSLAINAESKKEEDKLNQFLQKAALEDLTFQVNYNKETKETVISGMGELQINMILDKITEKQKIKLETRVPRIAYRESITKSANAEYAHKKQSGGHGQYGKVLLEIKPIAQDERFRFVNSIKGGAISKGYMPGIEKGILEAMDEGFLAGYPIVGIEAKVVDGKEHSVDSSEMAFKLAGKGALKAALPNAKPALLEPVMNLRIYADDQYMGDILSDLSSKRGKVLGQESLGGGIQMISAQVPQAELLRYSIDLRSITSGTGSFEMKFDHYNPISGKIAENVITASQVSKDEG